MTDNNASLTTGEHHLDYSNEYTSLPVRMQTTTISATSQLSNQPLDPELSDLLIRKQPKFAPQAPKCAKCAKSVYKAEETRAANKIFHKLCFKCNLCNKLLESNILTEHQGELYCRNCYAKKFGPKGYGYGAGAGTLSTDAGFIHTSPQLHQNQPDSNSSSSSEAHSVNTSSTSSNSSPVSGLIGVTLVTPTLKSTFSTNGGTTHAHHIVSPIGYRMVPNTAVTTSTSSVSSSSASSVSGISAVSNSAGEPQTIRRSSQVIFGGSDRCARCNKAVYAAEKLIAAGKPFHKLCFSCSSCKKMLSSMNCCDNSEGEIFCKSCYGKQYGPKGVGYGIGAGTLHTN